MKRAIPSLLGAIFLAGCGRLDTIPTSPPQTPEMWLSSQPFSEFQVGMKTILIVQPTTTAIVTLLGLIAIGAGLYIFKIRNSQRSRFLWGVALILWGVGALLAGVSYEAFSYAIKCAGRDICVWTSWWEIGYLFLSVASVDAMMLAEAYSCAAGRWRKVLTLYSLVNLTLYLILLVIGVLGPVKFLISFEMLILVAAPNIVIFLILNGWRYQRFRLPLDRVLLGAWVWLILTIGAYFLYYLSGLTEELWSRGIWFTENDVLHIGLIIWMVYLMVIVTRYVEDQKGFHVEG